MAADFRNGANAGNQARSPVPKPAVSDLAKMAPVGAGTDLMKGSDVSTLLNRWDKGNPTEQREAITKLVNLILEKDGDIHTKRELLRYMYESTLRAHGPIVVGVIMANEAGMKMLLEAATPSPVHKKRIDGAVSSYQIMIMAEKITDAFDILVSAYSPSEALLIAMKARGPQQGFDDAIKWSETSKTGDRRFFEDSFILTLLHPPGQIPQHLSPRHIDQHIREYLGA